MNWTTISLTHWGRVTHICVGKLTIIGSHNGLAPGRRQAIIWTNAGISLIRPLGTNFNEILIEIHAFSFKKIHLKISSGKMSSICPMVTEPEMSSYWRCQNIPMAADGDADIPAHSDEIFAKATQNAFCWCHFHPKISKNSEVFGCFHPIKISLDGTRIICNVATNSLAPGGFESNFRSVTFKIALDRCHWTLLTTRKHWFT